MYEELPFENEPVPAVGMSLSQTATCGHFNNKSCLESSAHGLTLSCSAQGSIDIFPLSKAGPISHVLWIGQLCDLCYFYWHGYSICLFCSENLLYVNIQSFKKVWYQHEDRKELLMTANSVFNIVTPGIFTSDAQLMFFPIAFFLSTGNQPVCMEQCLDSDLPDLFLCFCLLFFVCYFYEAAFWTILWACSNWHRWSARGANQWNNWMLPGNAANMQQNSSNGVSAW